MMRLLHHLGGTMLRELKCVAALAREKSYRRAALSLGISQSQLTRIVQSLENELGLTLFHRDRQGAAATAEGAAVLTEAAVLLSAQMRFLDRVEAIRSLKSQQIRLGVGAVVAQTWLPLAIARLAQKHPAISVSVREADWWKLAELVPSDEFDVVIGECSEAEGKPGISITHLPDRPAGFFVRAGHPLAGRPSVSVTDLASFALAAPRLPARVVGHFPALGKHVQVTADGRFIMPTIEAAAPRAILDIVLGSNAIGMSLPSFCREETERGTLVELPLRAPWLCIHQGIMLRKGRETSAAIRAFIRTAHAAERMYFAPGRPPGHGLSAPDE